MGFLGDLFGGGGSHSQTTTSTSTVTNTQLAGGNIAGPAVYGTGNSVILNSVDPGAIALGGAGLQAATDIGSAALALGASATAAGDTVAIAGLDHARDAYTSSLSLVGDVTRQALNNEYGLASSANQVAAGTVDAISNFAGTALERVSRFSKDALDSNTYIAGMSLDSSSQAFSNSLSAIASSNSKALGAIEDAYSSAFNTAVHSQDSAIAGVQQLAAQVSQSSQQTTDTTVQKIVWALVIGAVAIVVIGRGGLK